eukprot:symbB.v1.2.012548.t1/scaffold819.1/size162441/19
MTVTTYQSAYGSLAHWATASYDASWTNGLNNEGIYKGRRCSVHKTPRLRRAKSEAAVGRKQPELLCNSFNPFIARELPRGKFCSFPSKITRFPFVGLDPLGFTSYPQERAEPRTFHAGYGVVYGSSFSSPQDVSPTGSLQAQVERREFGLNRSR